MDCSRKFLFNKNFVIIAYLQVNHINLRYALCKVKFFTVACCLVFKTLTTHETIPVSFDGQNMDSNMGSEQVMVKE